MQSDDIFTKEIFNLAKSMPDKYPEMFKALEEYDRTRKLKKWNTKTRANFTLDANTLRQFRQYCSERGYKMSSLIERLMREGMKSRKN